MTKLKGRHIGLLAVAGLMILAGCTLQDPDSPSDEAPLSLAYQQNHSLTQLNWDKVKVTGFKEYVLLQSSTPIPNNPTPVVNQEVTLLKRIQEVDITTFSASATVFSPQICYKLYCGVDDRFLASDNICIDQHYVIIEGFYDRACHASGLDELAMFDRVNNHLTACNFKTGSVSNKVTDIVLNFPSMEMSMMDNVTNVFAYDQSPGWLRKYSYPALTALHSKNFSQVLWAAKVYNQFVFIGTEEFNKNFQVLNRSNLSLKDSSPGIISGQNIAVFSGSPLTVMTLGQTEAKKYLVDDAGDIISEEFITGRISQPDLQSTCADGTELFIGGRDGSIINRNGENAGRLNADINSFVMISRLSTDETKAIYIVNDTGVNFLKIADLSQLPIVSVLHSYEIPAMNYADLIVEEDIIYLIGTTFNSSQPQTVFLKYPL
jgi:hypothetical protein